MQSDLMLNPTVGALEVGITIAIYLFGVTTVQTYLYYNKFASDPVKTKILVATVWLLELAHATSASQGLYVQTITQYGEPVTLLKLPLGFDTCLFFSSGIALLAQCFFSRRVWIITKKKLVPITCYILATVRFIGSVVLAVGAYKMVTLYQYKRQWEWLVTFILVNGACVDIMIAFSLCFNLITHRRYVSDRLTLWTMETGLVTSLTALTMLVCFFTMTHNYVWFGISMILSRLFSNSLLASLNARSSLRKVGGFSLAQFPSGSAGIKSRVTEAPSIHFTPGDVPSSDPEASRTHFKSGDMISDPGIPEQISIPADVHDGVSGGSNMADLEGEAM